MFGNKILEKRSSRYNKNIKVIKSLGLGTYIQVNGLTQSGGVVESIWRSTLKKININNIKNILILGLGGGTVAKLLRKKYPNAKITGVEIDSVMIELGKKYLDLEKYNIDIKIIDAFKFLKTSRKKYGLVIVDTYLGDKVVDITRCHLAMAEITVFNRLYFGDKKLEAIKFGKNLKKYYKKVNMFYPQANVMFICKP